MSGSGDGPSPKSRRKEGAGNRTRGLSFRVKAPLLRKRGEAMASLERVSDLLKEVGKKEFCHNLLSLCF